MAQPDRITQPHAESILGPTVAAFSVFMLESDHLLGPIEEKLRQPRINVSVSRDLDRKEFAFQLYQHQILSAAYSVLVFTWERYRKAVRYSGTPEGSIESIRRRERPRSFRERLRSQLGRRMEPRKKPQQRLLVCKRASQCHCTRASFLCFWYSGLVQCHSNGRQELCYQDVVRGLPYADNTFLDQLHG